MSWITLFCCGNRPIDHDYEEVSVEDEGEGWRLKFCTRTSLSKRSLDCACVGAGAGAGADSSGLTRNSLSSLFKNLFLFVSPSNSIEPINIQESKQQSPFEDLYFSFPALEEADPEQQHYIAESNR
ncbi:hypothetical protein PHYBLDRAFT_182835 [Phycomyces blakesleeanus NRRL 1555(-)]|uniref:Uncharacterized protein n=1 Tax=Phycomyces blakesleeanus (strain ATCC 8743b / DSM 1359 / FGSC 10004 / NBRC 33097 / NRRL 1555) TaxID=763407 RepID=A0A167L6A6_PHYB8|nr:hypothetical protein PHYBLDRAFT_182835 [Phycomyces blakesleeanus NRRL 1555(-)]OAD69695.1 hypothetical protein PHYBLDRAFT_182835 [Phycomyces blakesleeanus NRRL 1555(-)]|eukprot:XP_018287735.1 hypothetical protein PHYBLDRAFT_182835 [Phycomyces blakesleeanus NRRL 1555(-)]